MIKYKDYILMIIFLNLVIKEKCFLFSVIIPIYNTGRYLDDSIGSIVNQTIGVYKIQLILINDGSIDESNEVCLKYQQKFIKNIIYIEIKHAGVSKARNIGYNYAKGRFLNFLDSDDKWDSNAFKQFSLFFKYHSNINYAAGRIILFEGRYKFHPLDYKFYKTRIVNLTQEYKCIQLQASSSIFKRNILKGINFKEEVYFSEDTRLINIILLKNPIMGIIREANYYYRKRNDLSSALQKKQNNLNYYFGAIKSVFGYFIKISKHLYNEIVPFIQFLISYEFVFRFKNLSYKYVDKRVLREYISLLEDILMQIEDKYILEQKIFSYKHKIYILSKKYHKDLRKEIQYQNNKMIYLNYTLINFQDTQSIIDFRLLEVINNTLYLKGIDKLWMFRENYFYFCRIANKTIFPKYIENSNYNLRALYGLIEKGRIIIFEIPIEFLHEPLILYFYLSYLDNNIEIYPYLGSIFPIPNINNGYCVKDKYIIKYNERHLFIYQFNQKLENYFEELYFYQLKELKKFKAIELRKQYFKNRNRFNYVKVPEIWIINDELDKAGGNGEYFFRFLKLKKKDLIQPYFIILNNSSDYKRLKKLGGILDIYSKEYKNIFLECNKIITSIFKSFAFIPFKKEIKYIRDLFHFDIIFIPNKINDIYKYNKIKENFYLIAISSKNEHKEIIKIKNGYNEADIIITGIPRYDNLYRKKKVINKERIILIIPNRRGNFISYRDLLSYKNNVINQNKYEQFFELYDKLINDKTLLTKMKNYNYRGIICRNDLDELEWKEIKRNELFIINNNCDFKKLLLKSSLLITEKFNASFDFGYLQKPIIYYHSAIDNYINNNEEKKYFDYSKLGFGPICKNIQCTIKEIIFELENNCTLRRKYLKRIKKFFQYIDDKNSKRVFKEIIKGKSHYNRNDKILNNHPFLYVYILIIFFINLKLKNIFS